MPINTWIRNTPGFWSTIANWSLGHVPLIAEDVVFDGTGIGNCTINTITPAMLSFTGKGTYTGTVIQQGRTMPMAGDCTWENGFDIGVFGGTDWIIGGDFSTDGQTLDAAAAWTLTVTGLAVAAGVTVEYSDASGGTAIDSPASTNTDGGNNINWEFWVGPPYKPEVGQVYVAGSVAGQVRV